MRTPSVHAQFDPGTWTITYVVWDPLTRDALIIDPVLDFDPSTKRTSYKSMNELLMFVRAKSLNVQWLLETHAHADHLTSARELRHELQGARWGMGARLSEVFENFRDVLKWPEDLKLASLGVDRWFRDGEEFASESLRVQVISTPGHTPACLTYRIGNFLFTGDALFMPDSGVGRCDFPGGSAAALYDSLWGKLYSLPDDYLVFTGHDYQPGGRPLRYLATLGEEKLRNIHLRVGTAREEFVRFREGRDRTLSEPKLLWPSIDWNLGAHQILKR